MEESRAERLEAEFRRGIRGAQSGARAAVGGEVECAYWPPTSGSETKGLRGEEGAEGCCVCGGGAGEAADGGDEGGHWEGCG